MSYLPTEVIEQRRNQLCAELLNLWHPLQGKQWYAIMCPCNIDCLHMPEDKVPRLRISACYFPGELDYFFVHQPYFEQYGFKVRWHCDDCPQEMDCGMPTDV